jgi:dGTP triphosphohydrolase
MLTWKQLLCPRRRKDEPSKVRGFDGQRTEYERDYDRILFSAPLRRLADKTQVFLLDADDSVHEVSNLARSIGVSLAFEHARFFQRKSSRSATSPQSWWRSVLRMTSAIHHSAIAVRARCIGSRS